MYTDTTFARFKKIDAHTHIGAFGSPFNIHFDTERLLQQMETYKKKFHMAELLIGAKGNTPITLRVEPRQKAQVPDRDKKSKKRER